MQYWIFKSSEAFIDYMAVPYLPVVLPHPAFQQEFGVSLCPGAFLEFSHADFGETHWNTKCNPFNFINH